MAESEPGDIRWRAVAARAAVDVGNKIYPGLSDVVVSRFRRVSTVSIGAHPIIRIRLHGAAVVVHRTQAIYRSLTRHLSVAYD